MVVAMAKPTRAIAPRLRSISILEALAAPELLGSSLIGDPASWEAWKAFLASFFGLPLLDTGADLFRQCTARQTLPNEAFQTAYLICGRGAGKSFVLALIATYLACFRDWSAKLAPGGKPVVLLIAPTREQAKIDLSTGVVVETGVPNYRSIRGRSICVALIDEVAFLRSDESANPDFEIMHAIAPSLGRFGLDGVLLFGLVRPRMPSGACFTTAGRNTMAMTLARLCVGCRRPAR